jgi:hypothetical protein
MVSRRDAQWHCLAELVAGYTKHQMKVVSYLATLPAKLLNSQHDTNNKFLTLQKYAQGVSASGDAGIISTNLRYEPADVAVMLGWVHENGKQAPHLQFRQHIIDQQQQHGGRNVIADSNLFLYHNTKNPHYYLRYSYDGIFPNTGEYCDANPDPGRWQNIRQEMGIHVRDWRGTGNHILLCLQRNGGWSMGNISVVDWATQTIAQLRQHTDRPIVIRSHPGDKRAGEYMKQFSVNSQLKNVIVGNSGDPLVRHLKHCWAAVAHNSSPTVGAAIEGVPVFVTDPARSQCRDIANTDLSQIENPVMPDRTAWLERISQFHWSHADLTSGRCWAHMKNWAKK